MLLRGGERNEMVRLNDERERESLVPESLMGIRLQLLPGISADDDDDDAFFSFQERNVCA